MRLDYFEAYLKYAGLGVSEPPATFHRWASIAIIGALLGRQCWIPFGHSRIYPNQYIMFMGDPGTRKSTAINIGAKLLRKSGFGRFASDRTSKERFLMDMCSIEDDIDEDALENLTLDAPAETFVVAEEFTDFIGHNNMEFLTMLTKLWDNPSEYTHPKIHGKSVIVTKPTINILSGNTAQNFAMAFPAEALGSGFLSRMIIVFGDSTGRKVTFPAPPNEELEATLIHHLKEIKASCAGQIIIPKAAEEVCHEVYTKAPHIDDPRFQSYGTRRFTHCLKLSMLLAAADKRLSLSPKDVIRANTLLYYTERNMPKALGEFGKSKYSEATSIIMSTLEKATMPMTVQDIWKRVCKDLSKIAELQEILKNLAHAEKIQTVTVGKKQGLLPKKQIKEEWDQHLLDPDWLTAEELGHE